MFLSILFLSFLASCDKNEIEEPINMGFNYFPVEKSIYSIYEVDSIVWNDFTNSIDTFSYSVKLLIDSQFVDNAGRTSYWWKKYVKTDSTNFNFVSNYTIVKTNSRVETSVENIREINLIFPLYTGARWNSNSLNSNNATDAICDDIDFQKTILNTTYDSCASIVYQDDVSLVQEFVHKAVFSRDVGMIYKMQIDKILKTTGLRGYYVEYKLSSYGKE
jgi:hypothetical protein